MCPEKSSAKQGENGSIIQGVISMAQISLRVDDDVKRGAEQALSDIGLSMSAAINVFLRKVARERRIPFELSAETPNVESIEDVLNLPINAVM